MNASFQIGQRMACVAGLLPPLMRSGGYSPANVASEVPPREALSPRLATLRGGLNSRPVFPFVHTLAGLFNYSPDQRVQPDHGFRSFASRNGARADEQKSPDIWPDQTNSGVE